MEHQFLHLIIVPPVLHSKCELTPNDHSMYIRFLWLSIILVSVSTIHDNLIIFFTVAYIYQIMSQIKATSTQYYILPYLYERGIWYSLVYVSSIDNFSSKLKEVIDQSLRTIIIASSNTGNFAKCIYFVKCCKTFFLRLCR